MRAQNASPQTIQTRINRIQHLLAYASKKGLHDVRRIEKADLEDFYVRLKEKGKHGIHSLGNLVYSTKAFFGFLEDEGVILKSPAFSLRAPSHHNLQPRDILTNEEVRRLLDQPNTNHPVGFRDRTILEVFVGCGLRVSEMANLMLVDVDLDGKTLRVNQGKGRKDRIVVLTEQARWHLGKYISVVRESLCRGLNERREPKSLPNLWVSRRRNAMGTANMEVIVSSSAAKAKIKKNVSPHTLRHTFATGLIKNKCSIFVVQKLLGHEHVRTTSQYTRVLGMDLEEQTRKKHPRERAKEAEKEAKPRIVKIKEGDFVRKHPKRLLKKR
jgi:integrase/recombinase XerD